MYKPALAAFAAVVILAAMPPAGAQQQVVQAQLDMPFELQFGQEAIVEPENISIVFTDLTEDSRCPSDVQCVWAGQATIEVSVGINGENAGLHELTIGAGEDKASATVGQYVIRLAGLEPYPISTVQTEPEDYVAGLVVSKLPANSAGVFVRAAGTLANDNTVAIISGWNLERSKGTLVMLVRDETTQMSVARFIPSIVECRNADARECIEGQVAETAGTGFRVGEIFHIEVVGERTLLFAAGDTEYLLAMKNIKTRQNGPTVELGEGDRNGPLLVQEIGADYVSGLNFPEYPIAVSEGLPVTLHVGESASNGCTITLTLLEIKQDTAVFSRTVDYNRPCPICFHSS